MPSFIADGYIFHAGVDAIKGVHDGLEFTYRHMTPAETSQYVHEANAATGTELRRIQARWLCEKIQSWQSRPGKDGKRAQIPPLTESLLVDGNNGTVINSQLLSQLIDIVIWGNAPDYTTDKNSEKDEVKNS